MLRISVHPVHDQLGPSAILRLQSQNLCQSPLPFTCPDLLLVLREQGLILAQLQQVRSKCLLNAFQVQRLNRRGSIAAVLACPGWQMVLAARDDYRALASCLHFVVGGCVGGDCSDGAFAWHYDY